MGRSSLPTTSGSVSSRVANWRKIPVGAGAPGSHPEGQRRFGGAAWGADGFIVFVAGPHRRTSKSPRAAEWRRF